MDERERYRQWQINLLDRIEERKMADLRAMVANLPSVVARPGV